MKIIDLNDRIIFVNTIISTYEEMKEDKYHQRYYNYYVQTTNGKYHISKEKYDEINKYLLSLNDEVEIIEEEKKIPKKLDRLIGYDVRLFEDLREYVEITTNDLFGKTNKIIDTLNQLIDYLNSKGK